VVLILPFAGDASSTWRWPVSIILSVLILMTGACSSQAPLEFSSFPTVPADRDHAAASPLNLASTRLILAHGHEGTAGRRDTSSRRSAIIVMSGNFRDRDHRIHDPGDREFSS